MTSNYWLEEDEKPDIILPPIVFTIPLDASFNIPTPVVPDFPELVLPPDVKGVELEFPEMILRTPTTPEIEILWAWDVDQQCFIDVT